MFKGQLLPMRYEYKLAKGWAIFGIVFAVLFIGGLIVAAIAVTLKNHDNPGLVLGLDLLILAFIFLLLMCYNHFAGILLLS